MLDEPLQGPLDLRYHSERQTKTTSAAKSEAPKPEAGPSSLLGRRGDNLTFHAQGATAPGYEKRLWGWAWKDLAAAFWGLLRIGIPSNRG